MDGADQQKPADPRIVYTEQYPDRSGAVRREYEIKRRKSNKYQETLIATRANSEE